MGGDVGLPDKFLEVSDDLVFHSRLTTSPHVDGEEEVDSKSVRGGDAKICSHLLMPIARESLGIADSDREGPLAATMSRRKPPLLLE